MAEAAAAAEEPAKAEAAAAAPEVAKEAPAAGKNMTLSYGLIGGGLVVAGVGGYFGMQALGLYGELDDKNNAMTAAQRSEKEDQMKEAALMNDVLVFPGLIAAGAGAYLLLQLRLAVRSTRAVQRLS